MLRRRNARFRVLGSSWWPEELPSKEEYATALATLERANWEVDYVITHCAPTRIALSMDRHNEADRLSRPALGRERAAESDVRRRAPDILSLFTQIFL